LRPISFAFSALVLKNFKPPHTPQEQQVEAMFNGIAHRYDLLNRVLSLGIDKRWRRKLVKLMLVTNPSKVLDIATGTADLAIALATKRKNIHVVGIDIAENMLEIGRVKIAKKGLSNRIELAKASALELPFPTATFDAAMVAFGVRNFENPTVGLSEINRVLKPGGTLLVLEFTNPKTKVFSRLYTFYFSKVLPSIGKMVSGHREAYTYLPNSVKAFAERDKFLALLRDSGYVQEGYDELSFGIAAIYHSTKPLI
jgi:demethylmenaquinone methyltransferase/2-methoxy-6-polyprenyl-1,4-benzoquinol methylase